MKKIFAAVALLTMAVGLSSCDDSVLSASQAKKALKKEAMFSKNYAVTNFNTGFYEVTERQLDQLAQLQAAGVISFTTETVKYQKRRSKYDFWRGYIYYFVDATATFADVKLTKDGEKYIVENPVTQREDLYKDFKDNENYAEAIPDYMAVTYNAQPAAPEVVEEVVVEEVGVDDSMVIAEDAIVEVSPVPVEPEAPVANNPEAPYQAALDRVNTTAYHMLMGQFVIKKVKEIRCTEEMAKNGEGKCQVIYTFEDKTPFGYVYGAPAQGYLNSAEAKFTYYNDMGWTVSSLN